MILQPEIFVDSVEFETFSVQWLAVKSASLYSVSLYDAETDNFIGTFETSDSFFEFDGVEPETRYKVAVEAVSQSGARSAAATFTVKTTPVPPKVQVTSKIYWESFAQDLNMKQTVPFEPLM